MCKSYFVSFWGENNHNPENVASASVADDDDNDDDNKKNINENVISAAQRKNSWMWKHQILKAEKIIMYPRTFFFYGPH